jgi:hypothetical protein
MKFTINKTTTYPHLLVKPWLLKNQSLVAWSLMLAALLHGTLWVSCLAETILLVTERSKED